MPGAVTEAGGGASAAPTTPRPCPICRDHTTVTLNGPQQRWRYSRCQRCAHLWLTPTPSTAELTEFYNSAYLVPREAYLRGTDHVWPTLRHLVQSLYPDPGRMLEVGCSYGAVLDFFQREGWDVEGIEIDARAAAYARQFFGLRIHEGRLEDVQSDLRPPYDLIGLYHVLEHMPDPMQFVRRLLPLARPGSVLLIRTPNASSLAARAMGAWWEWCAAPEHVHVFSRMSLERLLAEGGWRTEWLQTRRGDAHSTLFEVFRATAKRVLMADRSSDRLAPQIPISSRGWFRRTEWATDMVGAPVEWALRSLWDAGWHRGPELWVVGRRES